MKQIEMKVLTGQIVVVTGLHIGSGNAKVEIGGMDNPIIRNPLTREPYIPGSSIKGKMRSLMEWKLGRMEADGKLCSCGKADCPICRVFGSANDSKTEKTEKGPTRLIVRDAELSEKSRQDLLDNKPLVEEKSENSLNRITAKATPRPLERVVPGVSFDFNLCYRIIDTGEGGETDRRMFKEVVLQALQLLQDDYLGGGGTRGNGQIRFEGLKDEKGNEVSLA